MEYGDVPANHVCVPEGIQPFILGIRITVLIERMFPPSALFIAHEALSCDELLSF